MKPKTRIVITCCIVSLLVVSGCKFGKADQVLIPMEEASLQTLQHEFLGEHLHSNMRAFEIIDGRLHMLLTTNVTPATGTGQGLQYWTKHLDSDNWEKYEFLPDRIIGMANIVSDPTYTDDLFFIFNDRTNESFRYAIMERFDGASMRRVFELDQSEGQVLNPQAISSQDGYIHIFVPDRTSSGRDGIKWWRMNITTEELERLQDISLPTSGARLYDLIYDEGRIIVPIAIAQQLHLGIIDTEKLTITTQLLDKFTSPDRMPPRSINIFKYEHLGMYLLVYLRPTAFSNRPRTGLVGEVVVKVLDADFKDLSTTVIGGFNTHEAVTHYMKSEKLNDRMFAVAFTNVDEIHHFHLTGVHDRYVTSHLTVWEINESGKIRLVAKDTTDQTRWDQVIARVDDQSFLFTYNSTNAANDKWLDVMKLEISR
ncbi:MAG TPA: hypothetical protein GX739_04940 [Firmicutes bacterium]|nr:hypothetical protein [Bacillota bacterium]